MKKSVILGSSLFLISFVSPVFAAPSSPPTTYVETENPSEELSYDDWLKNLNGGLDGFEDIFKSASGGLEGALDGLLGGWKGLTSPLNALFEDASSLAGLVNRLMNLPSKMSGWWDVMLGTVTDTLDECSRTPEGSTPPFVYEPGWCMGSVGDLDSGGDSDGDGDGGDLDGDGDGDGGGGGSIDLPPGPYAGRKPTMGDIIKDSQGPAGIPDPTQIGELVSAAVDAGGGYDLFEPNPRVKKHYLTNSAQRTASTLHAVGTLGDLGQAVKIAEKIGFDQAVTSSVATAKAAQKLDVTQDVMKEMTQMQASQILLTGAMAVNGQGIREDNAWANITLKNISRSVDESNRNRRIDKSVQSQKVLNVTSRLALY